MSEAKKMAVKCAGEFARAIGENGFDIAKLVALAFSTGEAVGYGRKEREEKSAPESEAKPDENKNHG